MRYLTSDTLSFIQSEIQLYGSSRLGHWKPQRKLNQTIRRWACEGTPADSIQTTCEWKCCCCRTIWQPGNPPQSTTYVMVYGTAQVSGEFVYCLVPRPPLCDAAIGDGCTGFVFPPNGGPQVNCSSSGLTEVCTEDSVFYTTGPYHVLAQPDTVLRDSVSAGPYFAFVRGCKRYEIANHLGNILATVSDRKIWVTSSSVFEYHLADLYAVRDYQPFGMAIPERSWAAEAARFGFNGKEDDSEWQAQDYGERMYLPRQAWSSLDGVIWDLDARYHYYLHGPLARIELGQHKVQGLDYAYTLGGWTKALNSAALTPETDLGRDGLEAGTTQVPAHPLNRLTCRR